MEYVGFDGETFKSFKNIDDSRPLHMLNLVQLKKEVIYPDGKISTGLRHTRDMEKKLNRYSKNWEAQSFGEGIC